MKRSRTLILSLATGVAAVAGVFAVTTSISLGSEANASTDQQVARRAAQLDRYEASLRKALSEQPPPLPSLPTMSGTSARATPAASAGTASSAVSSETGEHEDESTEHAGPESAHETEHASEVEHGYESGEHDDD